MKKEQENERDQARILVIECQSTSSLGTGLRDALTSSNFDIQFRYIEFIGSNCNEERFSSIFHEFNPNLVVVALPAGLGDQAVSLIQCIRQKDNYLPIVSIVEDIRADELLALFDLGLVDFITTPFGSLEIQVRLTRLLERARQRRTLLQVLREKVGLKQIVGHSDTLMAEMEKVALLAKSDMSVLISGETGTGKELAARAIHYLSPRQGKPFVPVNCGAIPLDLIENELFGHERGSFTGAYGTQRGLIQEANSGTLFLDEVHTLQPLAQVKLLRFLQDKEYRPIGTTKVSKADVRIIAATNVDLEEALASGTFRQDLYYRLNVIPVVLPPLRERIGDITLLANHFLATYCAEFNKPPMRIAPQALQKLELYNWPGNVRELEHVIKRAVVLCDQDVITTNHLILPRKDVNSFEESLREMKAKMVSRFERRYIEGLLTAHNGNITKAAEAAKTERRTFWGLIRKYNINVQSFKSSHM